jgi:DNA-binding beta-propeller fold protein YncE
LDGPWGLAVDPGGHLFIADAANHRVRRVTPERIIATTAGTGTPGLAGDGGLAARARLNRPLGLAVDRQGNLFIVDSLNGRVRKVDETGTITTVFCAVHGGGGTGPASAGYFPPSWP